MDTDKLKSFEDLKNLKPYDIHKIDGERVKKCNIKGKVSFNYACSPVDDEHIDVFKRIVNEAKVFEKFDDLLSGKRVNISENRAVLHHLLRGNPKGFKVTLDGEDKEEFYKNECRKIFEFADSVREGTIKGSTGKRINTVVQIGIGGSDLGPRAMCIALSSYARANKIDTITPKFISNVDPEDAISVMSEVDPETTLFILVSKSGTTLETLQNKTIVDALSKMKATSADFNFKKHLLAVTSATSPLAKSNDVLKAFYMDDYIGGRYSSTSGVGLLVMSIAYGSVSAKDFLNGAKEGDENAVETDIYKNRALLDALIGIYERNVLGYPSLAILPYSEAMKRFAAHLEQLDMESNGKSVNLNYERVNYKTGPVIFGESGTSSQHSFYQHLHQGTDITPLEFIAFNSNSAISDDNKSKALLEDSHEKLIANVIAQMVAFAKGFENTNLNKNFDGGRPSSLIYASSLTPFTLGAILSHFENKVMFQGFIWNINSFDQEGVQLGKKLALSILDGSTKDTSLLAFKSILS